MIPKVRKRGRKQRLDPTQQSRNRNKTKRQLKQRLRKAESDVVALFRDIPYERITVNESAYNYLLSGELIQLVKITVRSALGGATIENWWAKEIEVPFRSGTLDEVRDFARKTAVGIADGDLDPFTTVPSTDLILISADYRAALERAQKVSTEAFQAFSDRLSNDVVRRLNAGIDARLSPAAIAADLHDRFDMTMAEAVRIADSEINKSYVNARLKALEQLGKESNQKTKVVHISALLPTTREWHASRHGKTYSLVEQLRWWDSGTERIHCHCNIQGVIETPDGKIVDAGLIDTLLDEIK